MINYKTQYKNRRKSNKIFFENLEVVFWHFSTKSETRSTFDLQRRPRLLLGQEYFDSLRSLSMTVWECYIPMEKIYVMHYVP